MLDMLDLVCRRSLKRPVIEPLAAVGNADFYGLVTFDELSFDLDIDPSAAEFPHARFTQLKEFIEPVMAQLDAGIKLQHTMIEGIVE